jgi:hypothetical protein
MTANSQVKIPTSSSYSRPSIPLFIYRELVQELETAKARIEVLEAYNQQIVKENKQLILYLQQLQDARVKSPSVKPKSPVSDDRNKQVIEIVSDRDRYTPTLSSKNDGSINGWVLAIALILIVLTSCLGAFLIVSSRLGNDQ